MIELDCPLMVTPSSEIPKPTERVSISAKTTAASGMNRNTGER